MGAMLFQVHPLNTFQPQEAAEGITYSANELNQYTSISDGAATFEPTFDLAGNQTLVKTATGTRYITVLLKNRLAF